MNIIIPAKLIKEYLREKFQDFRERNSELLVNSVFYEDTKYHMSINMDTGLWQDFKIQETGNFYHLVSFIEGISYAEAVRAINKKIFNNAPEFLFAPPPTESQVVLPNKVSDEFKNFKKINVREFYWSDVLYERLAARFIIDRGLERATFYYATKGKYSNRIIVPYSRNNTPYYFQARKLVSNGIKYINPTKEQHGVKSSEVLFPFDKRKNYVVITEGPVDALTLQLNGINATSTQGCHISYAQVDMLKGKKLIFSYDNDFAGREGLLKARKVCLARNISTLYTCSPPSKYKDWNDFHIDVNDKKIIFKEFEQNIQKMDFEYFAISQLL